MSLPDRAGDEDEELMGRTKAEMLRQLPVEELRALRRLQLDVQRMLKTEQILIMSREFDRKPRLSVIRRVMRFIEEEITIAPNPDLRFSSRVVDHAECRFKMYSKELLLVADPQAGLQRLCERLAGLQVQYCRLRKFTTPDASTKKSQRVTRQRRGVGNPAAPPTPEKSSTFAPMLFYTCSVDDAEKMRRMETRRCRQASFYQKKGNASGSVVGSDTNKPADNREEWVVPLADAQNIGTDISTFSPASFVTTRSSNSRRSRDQPIESLSEADIHGFASLPTAVSTPAFISKARVSTASSSENRAFRYPSLAADTATMDSDTESDVSTAVADVDDLEEADPFESSDFTMPLKSGNFNDSTRSAAGVSNTVGRTRMHDFWLVIEIVQKETLVINIYFCQRSSLMHSALYDSAVKMVEQQIKRVNQELLLEKMQRTEECDQLLVDDHEGEGIGAFTSRIWLGEATLLFTAHIQIRSKAKQLQLDDEFKSESAVSELVRYKYAPGFFACPMMWHHWFPLHPRLQSSRSYNTVQNIGFDALRYGLAMLAVRNRSNMYVFREKSGNVVYMRLHATEASITRNIQKTSQKWREEVQQNVGNSVLLSVHGVQPPGEEITVELTSVLQRRLNQRTLEEIQTALLKNAHIRLEASDIKVASNKTVRKFT
ncbi:hypothetical protein AAVH_09190 [Aphelenchoides avenae]|nr:hypothetical protein AAVH_09190 [Aphelenchus avenae]